MKEEKMKKYRILFRLNASRIMDFYTHDFNLAHQWCRDLGFQYKKEGSCWIEADRMFETELLSQAYTNAALV